MMRNILLALLLVSITTQSFAMEPHFISRELNEAYAHLTINRLFQDRNCMIWLATSEGLLQFTGSQIIPIPFPDSLAPMSVTALYEDRNGTIWAGTETGRIFRYTVRDGLTLWNIEEGMPQVRIKAFLEDDRGQFWIATYGEGLYVYSQERLYNINRDDGLLEDDIYVIALDGKGRIWAGTDQGVSLCTFDGKKDIHSLTLKDGLPDQIVRALCPDKLGNMWIATYEAGFAYFDITQDRITAVSTKPVAGHISAIAAFDDLELWFGTEGNGLWRFLPATGTFTKIRNVEDLHSAYIKDLLKDVEGNIWVVSGTNILHTAFRPFETLDIPIGNIQSLFAMAQDQLWLGTEDGLYHVWQDTGGIWQYERIPHVPFTSVACLGGDNFGNLWIGALDIGLCVYDPRTRRLHTFDDRENLHHNPIISLFIENETMWLATLGRGVMQIGISGDIMHGGSIDVYPIKTNGGDSHSFVFQVMPKEGGEAWLATDGAGLGFTQETRIETLMGTQNTAPKTIYSMTTDYQGHLWLNTEEQALVEYDGQNYKVLDIEDGLRSLDISGLVSTPKGEILIVHNKGIDVLLPKKRHFMYFDDEIGLQGATPVLNAVYKDTHGNIWIGMQNKIVKYSAVKENFSIHPRTRIEHVSVNQSPIDFHTMSLFPARRNFFEFDYVGLWYTSPASVKYLYTLEGHDVNWKESGDHLAIYSNLKPGQYVFRVKASENKFFYDEPLAEYAFEIRKPIWQAWWFISLAILCGLFLVYLFIKTREARLRRIEILNKEKIESQFRALKAQINPHFLFNSFNTLITIIDENTGNPEVPIEYVQKLSDFYRNILQYREEEAISIPEEITLVKNYYYLLQRRYGDNLHLEVNINGTVGFVPPLTLQMLVENAVKHNVISKANPLTIQIRGKNNEYLVVENNLQRKISDAPSTRFGLQSIVNRYELISNKRVLIEETATAFKVSIPIIKIHCDENRHH